jgi:hypothetical protein
MEDISTPVLLRSEVEQLVRQKLTKALSDFNQLTIAPLSPHTQQFTSYVKKSIVEHPVDTQNFNQRIKIKSHKLVNKVIRDLLTNK